MIFRTAILALASLTAAATSAFAQGGPPPANVRTDEAIAESVVLMRQVSGDLRAVKRSMVASKDEGLVMELLVDVGDVVQAGQVLATLDTVLKELDANRLRADRDADEAELNVRRAEQRQTQRNLDRREVALESRSINATEVEDARIALDAAKARVAAAEAELASSEAELARALEIIEDATIRAPFAGQVVRKQTEVGSWVVTGGTVVELVQLDRVDAYIQVPETFVSALTGDDVTVGVIVSALDEQIDSDRVSVIASGDELARTFPVRIRLDNPTGVLKPGMSVRALIPTGSYQEAVTIHKDALLRDDGGAFAYADVEGAAMPIRFDVRWRVGDRIVVSSPRIQAGMKFVIEGNERLFPTQPLNNIDAAPDSAQSATTTPTTPGG